ncbi:hypothetical protein [Geodermatophilus chilensis]|uniref:hypothetical protein n=1 Tax=Geodermatophilus chilensis TaxID=2035835 RepID=UPI0018E47A3C|nr:hypothetical protein [Geodermatophilus chilensis]
MAASEEVRRAAGRHVPPTPSRASRLQVYVSAACTSCRRAGELVSELRRLRPGAAVELVDLDRLHPGARPASLVGTPTYVLRGRVRWLGNPSPEDLLAGWDEEEETDPEPEGTRHGR